MQLPKSPHHSAPVPAAGSRPVAFPTAALLLVLVAHPPAAAQEGGGRKRQEQPPATVTVAEVTAASVRDEQEFVGTVQPRRRVRIGSGAEGRVIGLLVRRGDRVTQDQELVRIRDVPTRLQLEAARRELALRSAEALEARNGPRPEEIAIAKARLAAAEATLSYEEWSLQRAQELHRQEMTSEEVLRQGQLKRDSARAARDEAKAQLELLQAGTRAERIAQAEARVAEQAEAIRLLEDHLDKLVIRAPFTAFVSTELTEVGAWLERGTPVIELLDLDDVEIEVPVPEGATGQVRVGSKAAAVLPSLAGRRFEGTVIAVVPDAEPRSRTVPIRIRVRNEIPDGEPPLLKAGMLASVRLPVGAPRDALLVPKDALVLGGPSPIVYMLTGPPAADGLATVKLVPVTLAFGVGDQQVVSGPGLVAGAKVVVRGNERLRPGQAVRVVDSSEADRGSEQARPGNRAGSQGK